MPPSTNEEKKTPDTHAQESRRDLIKGTVGVALVAVIGYFSWTRYFFPPGNLVSVGLHPRSTTGAHKYAVGNVATFTSSKDPVQVSPDASLAFVDFNAGYPQCLSGICTHQGCAVQWTPESNFYFCPCHGSKYARNGKVINGPAKKPLPTLPCSVEGGTVYVQV